MRNMFWISDLTAAEWLQPHPYVASVVHGRSWVDWSLPCRCSCRCPWSDRLPPLPCRCSCRCPRADRLPPLPCRCGCRLAAVPWLTGSHPYLAGVVAAVPRLTGYYPYLADVVAAVPGLYQVDHKAAPCCLALHQVPPPVLAEHIIWKILFCFI